MSKLKIIPWDGKPIIKPGVYGDVPLHVYHSQGICDGPSVSSSGLRRILERNGGSPAHFYNEWSGNPDHDEQEHEKPHFVFGRAVHHLLLGEGFFQSLFCIRPDEVPDRITGIMKAWQSNRLECRAWTADDLSPLGGLPAREFDGWFEANRPRGRAILTRDDIEDIRGMSKVVGRHHLVNMEYRHGDGSTRRYSLLNGHIEKSFFWRDKKTGLWCKARPDAIPTESGDFADLKTTTSVSHLALMRTISDFAYHQQAAMIMDGSKQCAGIDMSSYTLVFVEKKKPWCVRPVPLDMEDVLLGHAQNRIALDLIAQCMREKRWPGPGEDHLTSISLSPNYRAAAKRDVDQIQREEKVA